MRLILDFSERTFKFPVLTPQISTFLLFKSKPPDFYEIICRFSKFDSLLFVLNIKFEFEKYILDREKSITTYSLYEKTLEELQSLRLVVEEQNEILSANKKAFEQYRNIYTGKDIGKYSLKKASRYVKYNRADFQQCAKDEFYRAKEKLVYKFVSSHLCFTYDDKQRLFLNSANILIPEIDSMSTKTVLAFLNSSLFNFLYAKRFNDLKILKGNLSTLPFPKLTPEQDQQLSSLVDRALNGDKDAPKEIDGLIYALYEFNSQDIALIVS